MALTQWFRKKRKVIFAVLCAVLIATWVVGGALSRLFAPRRIGGGRIFGRNVPAQEVSSAAERLWRLARDPDSKLHMAHTWEHLIYIHEAERLGLRVSDAEIDSEVARMFPAALGGVNAEALNRFLDQRRLTVDQLRRTLREHTLIGKLHHLAADSFALPENDAWRRFARENETTKVKYAAITAHALQHVVRYTDAEVKQFYEKHKNTLPSKDRHGVGYQAPEHVRIDYLLAPLEAFGKKVSVTDKEIEAYYSKHKEAEFRLPDKKPEPKKPRKAKGDEKAKPKPEKSKNPGNPKAGDKPRPAPKKDHNPKPAKESASDSQKAETPPKPRYSPLAEVRDKIEKRLRTEKARKVAGRIICRAFTEMNRRIKAASGATQKKADQLARKVAKEFGLTYKKTACFSADKIPPVFRKRHRAEFIERAFNQSLGRRKKPTPPEGDLPFESRDRKSVGRFRLIQIVDPKPTPLDGKLRKRVIADLKMYKAYNAAVDIATAARHKPTFEEAVSHARKLINDLAAKAPKKKPAAAAKPSKSVAKKTAQPRRAKPDKAATAKADKTGAAKTHKPKPKTQPKEYIKVGETPYFTRGAVRGRPPKDRFWTGAEFVKTAFSLKANEVGLAIEGETQRAACLLKVIHHRPVHHSRFQLRKKSVMGRMERERGRELSRAWRAGVRRRADPSPEVLRILRRLPAWEAEAAE